MDKLIELPLNVVKLIKEYLPNYCGNYQNSEYLRFFIYRETHREMLRERNRLNREKFKEKISARQKEYYQANKTKLLENAKMIVNCECGRECKKGDLSRHRKTNIHQKYLENNSAG